MDRELITLEQLVLLKDGTLGQIRNVRPVSPEQKETKMYEVYVFETGKMIREIIEGSEVDQGIEPILPGNAIRHLVDKMGEVDAEIEHALNPLKKQRQVLLESMLVVSKIDDKTKLR